MNSRVPDPRIPPHPNIKYEHSLWQAGCTHIAGVDEAGRGPLAGPVSAAVVILPSDPDIETILNSVNDSKKLSAKKRAACFDLLKNTAVEIQTGMVNAAEIDELGILNATREAVWRAVQKLNHKPDHFLLDYLLLSEIAEPQTSLPKGDARSLTIACASIAAKETRDTLMMDYHQKYPEYGFDRHKGYGTKHHRAMIEKHGPCPIHRLSFRPIAQPDDEH